MTTGAHKVACASSPGSAVDASLEEAPPAGMSYNSHASGVKCIINRLSSPNVRTKGGNTYQLQPTDEDINGEMLFKQESAESSENKNE